jgi:hypothetical protein
MVHFIVLAARHSPKCPVHINWKYDTLSADIYLCEIKIKPTKAAVVDKLMPSRASFISFELRREKHPALAHATCQCRQLHGKSFIAFKPTEKRNSRYLLYALITWFGGISEWRV